MKAVELLDLLPAHSVLGSCAVAEIEELLAFATVNRMRKGDTILEQGEEGDSLIVLLSGGARVSMIAPNGREIILDYAEPGEMLGEIALLDGEPRTASVNALGEGRYLRIRRRAFEIFIERHPKVALCMMQEMARRLRQTDATIESDRAFTSGPRIARHLKRLSDDDAGGAQLRLNISQGELGNFVGISREHVNRQLAAWADQGVIELEQGRIRILDGEYLSELAESGM